jgi:hypothetical protein
VSLPRHVQSLSLGQFNGPVLRGKDRTPFAFFSAMGLLSLSTGSGVVSVDDAILGWIKIWTSITRPFWDFVLSPIENFFSIKVPPIAQDYLTLSVVTAGMIQRSFICLFTAIQEKLEFFTRIVMGLTFLGLSLFAWPILVLALPLLLTSAIQKTEAKIVKFPEEMHMYVQVESLKSARKAFFETFVWFLLLLAMNYALLFKNGEFRFGNILV